MKIVGNVVVILVLMVALVVISVVVAVNGYVDARDGGCGGCDGDSNGCDVIAYFLVEMSSLRFLNFVSHNIGLKGHN